MWFLLKSAFWIGLVVMLLPPAEGSNTSATPQIGAAEAFSLLNSAVNDARGFCERNPQACVTGAVAVQSFGYKAQHGAKMLHEFISTTLEDNKNLVPPPAAGRQKQGAAHSSAPSLGQQPQRG